MLITDAIVLLTSLLSEGPRVYPQANTHSLRDYPQALEDFLGGFVGWITYHADEHAADVM